MKEVLNQSGFTLVELMITLVATSILLIGVYAAMFSGNDQLQEADIKMAIQDQGREGLYKMIQEIRQSAPSRITIDSGATSGSQIEFQLPDAANLVDSSYALDWSSATTVTYALSGTQLQRQVAGVVTDVVANDVASITFTGDSASPSVVTVTMGLQRNSVDGRSIPASPMQLAGQAEVRNS